MRKNALLAILTLKGDSILKYGVGKRAGTFKRKVSQAMENMPSEYQIRKQEAMLVQVEFNIMLLTYMMNSDDGVITKDEKKLLKQNMEEIFEFATKEELKEMGKRLKEDPHFTDIKQFCIDHNLSKIHVNKAMVILKSINGNTDRYSQAINELETSFQYQTDLFK